MAKIANETPQTLGFYISATRYFEKKTPRFPNISNILELIAELVVDNSSQVVMDSEKEKLKKKNKCMIKKTKRFNKLCVALILATESAGSSLLLCLLSGLATESSLLLCSIPALVSRLKSPTLPLPCFIPALVAIGSVALLLPSVVPASVFCLDLPLFYWLVLYPL